MEELDGGFAFMMGVVFSSIVFALLQLVAYRRRRRRIKALKEEAFVSDIIRNQAKEVEDLHARLAVLERIATDPATRTAHEIETLR